MTPHAYVVELDRHDRSAGLLRIMSVVHARGAEVQSLSYDGAAAGGLATVDLVVVPRTGGAGPLAGSLRRLVHVHRVDGPREVTDDHP